MTDAWCHGGLCGTAAPRTYPVKGWRSVRLRDVHVFVGQARWYRRVCPGCHARENPHATGPHTRIVEEWEHEYGALCRVVVGPLVAPPERVERWADYVLGGGCDLIRRLAVLAGITLDVYGQVEPWVDERERWHGLGERRLAAPGAEERLAVAIAMLDAERLALKWSPPVDEEEA